MAKKKKKNSAKKNAQPEAVKATVTLEKADDAEESAAKPSETQEAAAEAAVELTEESSDTAEKDSSGGEKKNEKEKKPAKGFYVLKLAKSSSLWATLKERLESVIVAFQKLVTESSRLLVAIIGHFYEQTCLKHYPHYRLQRARQSQLMYRASNMRQ